MNIAIDGPAGAGKSSIAKLVAKKLEFVYIDTGAMYRAMALYFIKNGIDTKEEAEVSAHCDEISITITYENGSQQIFLNGNNVSAEIRNEQVGNQASVVAAYGCVREKLVAIQREMGGQFRCYHGWPGYRNSRTSGCRCQDLSHSKFCREGAAKI